MARIFGRKEQREEEEEEFEEQENPNIPQKASPKPEIQYVEREITLSTINDKLNYLIGLVQEPIPEKKRS